MNTEKKSIKILKAASPEVLFMRFLQKQSPEPTQKQLTTWDNDGGHNTNVDDEEMFVVIQGKVCRTRLEMFKARLAKLFKSARTPVHN